MEAMNTVDRIQLIRAIFPDSREADLIARLERLKQIISKNQENASMTDKSKNYSQGFDIGEWLAVEGEDLDIKDIDQIGSELLEMGYGDLPVTRPDLFKDGLLNGYVYGSGIGEEEE